MNRRDKWMERLAKGLDLQQETMPGQSLVEISGENRIFIENHRGVSAYGSGMICVNMKYGMLSIQGCELEVQKMTDQQLVICGRIDSVVLKRRRNP